jgi:hypothetical protein
MADGVTSSTNAPANQADHGADSSSADSAAQTEFAKAKQSAIAEKPTSTAQERDKESGLAHHGAQYAAQTGGTDKKNLGATAIGSGVIDRHPKGRTLAVPNNYDRAKVKAYKERINDPFDRGVAIRSVQPGTTSRTNDIRNRQVNKDMVDNFAASHGGRPPGQQVDHTVELQHIGRPNPAAPGADTVRAKDHRFQDARVNSSQGRQGQLEDLRQIRAGAPEDVPAGGVARVRDLNKITNTQGYRTVARAAGTYATAGGTYAALKGVGEDIRAGNFGSAALGTSAYLGGASELGAVANLAITGSQSTLLLNGARVLGAPAAVAGAAVVGVQIGTYLNDHYVNKEGSMEAGDRVAAKYGPIAGGVAAAGYAIGSAAYHAPEAAVDYAKKTWTVDPSEVDWDRTLKPWKWF